MIRNIATVLSGSLAAQIIMIAALPFLSRLYDAESFGKYQIYISTLNVMLMVVAFRYEVALLSAKKGKQYNNLLRLIPRIILLVSILVLVLVLISSEAVIEQFPNLSSVIYIFPIAILIGGFYQTLTYLPIRNRDYRLSAKSKVVQSTSYAGAGIAFAFFPFSTMGLIFADIIARAMSGLNILRGTPKTLSLLSSKITRKMMKNSLFRFRAYPFITFPGTLLSSLVAAMVPFALLSIFDLTTAGQYSLVERFILVPIGAIAAAIAQVFTGDFASKITTSQTGLNKTYRKTILWLALVAIIPSIVGYLTAPWLVPKIFGSQWVLAGQLCAAAIPIAFITFIVMPVNMTLIICNKQKVQFIWEVTRFILVLSLFSWIYQNEIKDPVTVISWYAIAVVIAYVLYLLIADKITRQEDAINQASQEKKV